MAADIANGDATLSASAGSASITASPSTKDKLNGKGIFSGSMGVSVSGATQGSCVTASGAGSISPTATKDKAEGAAVIRKGDSTSVSVTGVDPSQMGAPCNFSVDVEVDDAGQDKAQGN